jgi:hypothetical protein
MCDYPWPDHPEDPLVDSGVYNIANGMITPLLSVVTDCNSSSSSAWPVDSDMVFSC